MDYIFSLQNKSIASLLSPQDKKPIGSDGKNQERYKVQLERQLFHKFSQDIPIRKSDDNYF